MLVRRRYSGNITVVDGPHPIVISDLMRLHDDLISGFQVLLDKIQWRQKNHKDPIKTACMMMTVQSILELVFDDYGGWAFLQLGQGHRYFLQRMQQQHLLTIPQHQQTIEYPQKVATPMMGQAHSQDIIERQKGAKIADQQQASSDLDKHERFLDRFNAENEHNEKMKNRYADDLALKARVELEAEKNKAIEMEKESARKLEEARQRLEKTRIENERKEDMLMRTDEAVSRADELQHQAREMMQKAKQEKRDSERRIEERRREAAAKRAQGRQLSYNDSRSRTDEWGIKGFSYENIQMRRVSTDRTFERGYGERGLREEKDKQEGHWHFDEDDMPDDNHRQQKLLENTETQGSVATLPKHIVSDSDDDDSDSDEEKRQDPYQLIGLSDRERTPVKDIETTQRVLNRIHQISVDNATEEATRKHTEKRLVEIKWAANILLDDMNKRAYDEDGSIYPHEQQSWKKKSKSSIKKHKHRD